MPHAPGITIRPAVAEDANGIAAAFLESAVLHASLDPERYTAPALETISERYRYGRQHPSEVRATAITLVAEISNEVVGFVDARLEKSPDPMHREMLYCQVTEIAVSLRFQNQSIGARLLKTVEDWGRHQGAEFAILEYLVSNTAAGRFYEQHMGYSRASITVVKRL